MKRINSFTPANLGRIFAAAGFPISVGDETLYVNLQHEGQSYPVVVLAERKEVRISCQIETVGSFNHDELSRLAISALAENMQMLPYSIAMLKPEAGASEEEIGKSPIVLVNSVSAEDLQEEELIWEMRQLQRALITALVIVRTAKEAALAA